MHPHDRRGNNVRFTALPLLAQRVHAPFKLFAEINGQRGKADEEMSGLLNVLARKRWPRRLRINLF